MKTERQVVEKIIELAYEQGKRQTYLKFEADKPVENSEQAIKKRDIKLQDMETAIFAIKREISLLKDLFKD